eukprot:1923228-Rhodomonas_salina.3
MSGTDVGYAAARSPSEAKKPSAGHLVGYPTVLRPSYAMSASGEKLRLTSGEKGVDDGKETVFVNTNGDLGEWFGDPGQIRGLYARAVGGCLILTSRLGCAETANLGLNVRRTAEGGIYLKALGVGGPVIPAICLRACYAMSGTDRVRGTMYLRA